MHEKLLELNYTDFTRIHAALLVAKAAPDTSRTDRMYYETLASRIEAMLDWMTDESS